MTDGLRSEGLEELSEREEGFDREQLEATYAELYEEVEATSFDRRTLLAGGHSRDRLYVGDTSLLESAVVWSQRLKPYGLSQDPEFEWDPEFE